MLSIIMPIHKWSRYTVETFKSILSKHREKCELIVLIDGDDKQTIAHMKETYQTRPSSSNISLTVDNPMIRTFLTSIRNKGMELAKYNNVLVINDDVVLSEGFDTAICEELKDHMFVCPKFTEGKQVFATKPKEKRGNIAGRCRAIKKNDRPLIGPIDERIKVWYNDDRIYRKLTDMKQVPHWSNKVYCHHYRSQTIDNPDTKVIIHEQIQKDEQNRKDILKEHGRYDERFQHLI